MGKKTETNDLSKIEVVVEESDREPVIAEVIMKEFNQEPIITEVLVEESNQEPVLVEVLVEEPEKKEPEFFDDLTMDFPDSNLTSF